MSDGKTVRVVVVDDNDVIRHALKAIVRHDERCELVGEATSGEAAMTLFEAAKPDVVCLDLQMPGMTGLDVLRHIREKHTEMRAIIITGVPTSDAVKEALSLGASAFIVKPFNAAQVLSAIHAAAKGAE